MLEVKRLRSEKDRVMDGLRKRNFSVEALQSVDEILTLDDQRKETQTKLDGLLSEAKQWSAEIGALFKAGQQAEADQLRQKVANGKDSIKALEASLKNTIQALQTALLDIPNIPHDSVPSGDSESDNEVVTTHGEVPVLPVDDPRPHWELAERYNLIDFRLGAKIAGSGFPLFRNRGAKLQRALVNFFLAEAARAGYEEIAPPLLVNADTALATGQLPDKEGQMYHVEKDNLYLIPTAEVPITNILRDVTLSISDLPMKLTGYTPCFRREAGSYGAHVKGLNRVHQFDKVEIVQIAHPEESYRILDEMVAYVAQILQKLGLPYRVLRLCAGDLGFTSALTFDFEVYSAAQKKWLEVSSVSNFETFQSNRLKVRFKDSGNKPQLCHTLNGSALALARIIAAILENNQDADGIKMPEVLHPYLDFTRINN